MRELLHREIFEGVSVRHQVHEMTCDRDIGHNATDVTVALYFSICGASLRLSCAEIVTKKRQVPKFTIC